MTNSCVDMWIITAKGEPAFAGCIPKGTQNRETAMARPTTLCTLSNPVKMVACDHKEYAERITNSRGDPTGRPYTFCRTKKTPPFGGESLGGEGGIRTHGDDKRHNGFRDRPDRPLRHLSSGQRPLYLIFRRWFASADRPSVRCRLPAIWLQRLFLHALRRAPGTGA